MRPIYLGVKGICRQSVGTLESVSVSLTHDQAVVISSEDLSLVKCVQLTWC